MGRTWRLGTRGSLLARTQSGHVADALRVATGDDVELVIVSTRGDRITDRPLREVGGKGLFTQELEDGLRDGSLDFAVHSLKDLPSDQPDGLCLGAVPRRADPRDVLIGASLAELPRGARVGTGSARRRLQLLAARPDLEICELRGNVDTRIRRVTDGALDAVMLAAAGVDRIGRGEVIAERVDVSVVIPAAAQGALAVQCRADDAATLALLAAVHDPETSEAVEAERAFLAALGGGCSVPAACHVRLDGSLARILAFHAGDDGLWREDVTVSRAEARAVASALGAGRAARAR
jgi:hydroxymethylbilane synthase